MAHLQIAKGRDPVASVTERKADGQEVSDRVEVGVFDLPTPNARDRRLDQFHAGLR
jgi:hypothetical protein